MAKQQRSNDSDKQSRNSRPPVTDESDEFIYAVCESFFNNMAPKDTDGAVGKRERGGATAVARQLAKQFNRDDLSRERIYPLLWEAVNRKFLIMNPPVENDLQMKLIEKFGLREHIDRNGGDVTVVNVVGRDVSRHVSSMAADRIITLIEKVQREKEEQAIKNGQNPEDVRVHLGLGAGYAAMILADRLATRANFRTPKLTLHALTPGGFYIAEQQNSPTAYFLRFTDKFVDVECIGMFAPPVVATDYYEVLRGNSSLRTCYERRDEIDILVTSLATSDDEHGLVRQYFKYLETNNYIQEDVVKTLEEQGWVGDVLFQPYSVSKAIHPETQRTVALFEIEELLEFSQKPGKHVVVIGAPCNVCKKLKTDALRPLLEQPSLRLWNQLVIDRQVAIELLKD